MIKKLLILMTLLAGVLCSRGESIEECRRLAENNYPLVKRYDVIRQTEQFILSNIAKGWLPQISGYAQGSGQNAVPEWPEALQSMLSKQGYDVKGISPMQYRAGLDVQQTIYDGGAINAARETAKAQSAVETAQNDVDIYALRKRVEDVCFSWLLVEERLKQNAQLQTLLSANVEKLQALHDKGVALGADVDVVRAELATARQQKTELESARTSLQKVLALLCGQRIENVERPSEEHVVSSYNNAHAEDAALEVDGRPEFRLFDAKRALFDAQERSLRAQRMPKLGLFVQGYYGYTGFDMFHDMLHREPSFNALAGARLIWNISSFYTKRGNHRRIEAQRQGVETQRETFVFNQRLQAANERQNILRCERLLADDDEIVSLRHKVRVAAEARLGGGIIDTNGLLQEINRENQAVINRSIHEIEHLKAVYEYNNTLGK